MHNHEILNGKRRTMRYVILLAGLSALSLTSLAVETTPDDLLAARRAFDTREIERAEVALLHTAEAHPDSYADQFWAAEACRLHATALRNQRYIKDLSGKVKDAVREHQAELGKTGLPFAERALELAKTDAEKAQAHRVIAELYTHRITGMISGMRFGSSAKQHLDQALSLAPDDPECRRTQGIMYLHNPPINGGDIPRAIEVFAKLSQEVPHSDIYPVLLAMAYRKHDEPEKAGEAAKQALRINADNQDAQALTESLEP
jgi:tetratricopeptide (TPR) repeat protein